MHEGRQLKQVASVTEADVKEYCSYFPQDIDEKAPKWIREIFMLAARYDDVAE